MANTVCLYRLGDQNKTMCGSYELKSTAKNLIRYLPHLHITRREMPSAGEVAPADFVPVITRGGKGYVASPARWGLVGHFLDRAPRLPVLTLRGEDLPATPFYSKLLAGKRCLIPATAFFGWQTEAGSGKRKMRIGHAKGEPLLLAGVFDHHPQAGSTCAILTTAAGADIRHIGDRMPLVLDKEVVAFWLAEHEEFPAAEFAALLQAASRCPLLGAAVKEPEPSPQLAFCFS